MTVGPNITQRIRVGCCVKMTDIVFITLLLLSTIFTGLVSCHDHDTHPIVQVQQGKLQGFSSHSRNGRDYFTFEGVPYGKQPERFEVAEFPDKWEGVRQAVTPGNLCPQMNPFTMGFEESEDCLFLNIYTPKLNGKFPVMVFVHGGGFMFGAGHIFGGKYFMDEDVVLVTINYRVNVFGFLSTEDSEIQGNFGMKDQVLALQWIKENIASFGGNPEQVTIFGMSAGGASANYLLMSPLAKGLFQTAISQSGSALNPWAFQREPKANAGQIAKFLQCPIDTSANLKQCLKRKSVKEIIQAYLKFSEWGQHPLYPFSPSVEKIPKSGSSAPVFLSDSPFKLMSEGKVNKGVNWVTGMTRFEGNTYVGSVANEAGYPTEINDKTAEIFSLVFGYDVTTSKSQRGPITDQILKQYFGQKRSLTKEHKDVVAMSSLFGDRYFNFGIWKAAELVAKIPDAGLVYPYLLTALDESFTWGDAFFGKTGLPGPAHADCILYQFNMTAILPIPDQTGEVLELSRRFIKLWVSIAKNGKPTDSATWGKQKQWSPANKSGALKWYNINTDTKETSLPFQENLEFWDDLPLNELSREKSYKNHRDEL